MLFHQWSVNYILVSSSEVVKVSGCEVWVVSAGIHFDRLCCDPFAASAEGELIGDGMGEPSRGARDLSSLTPHL